MARLAGELVVRHADDPESFCEMGRSARRTAESLDWGCVVQEMEALLYSIA